MKETVKKLVCMIAVITIVFAVPGVAKAEDIYEEETAAGTVVDSDLKYGPLSLYIFDRNLNLLEAIDYSVGDSYNSSIPVSGFVLYRLNLNILHYMTAEQKYLLFNSVDTTVTASIGFSLFSDPSFSAISFEPQYYSSFNGQAVKVISFSTTSNLPVKGTYEAGYSDYFYQSDVNEFYFRSFCYFHSDTDRLYDIDFTCTELSLTIRTVGADKSTADIVINLGKIEDSINQGFDNLGNQIGGVQDDINSGFDEVGGKLDNIQSDINTGLDNVTGAINGAGSDTSGMDSGMAQLGGQLGDLGNVEDELGGLIMDKVEVPDLILTNDQGSALALLVSCLNLAYVDLKDYQVLFASVMFFGIIGVLLFGRRNL